MFSILFIYSQNNESKSFILKWNDNTIVQINDNHSISLPLVENNYFNPSNIPTYITSFNVQKNILVQDYQIKNVKFSNLSTNSLKSIDI
ncbi:MAG: hypothetical protein KAT78_08910, partial [Flavobacteriaceae bacterium]|nr:hypothetical protein [Flavobacteriaceae bacterium]